MNTSFDFKPTDWLDTLTLSPISPPTDPSILDSALRKVITAVARLHRAGPTFKHRSEAFWIFAAGCVNTRREFDEAVREEGKKLERTMSVEEDLLEARKLVNEAVETLRREGVQDAEDLEEAVRVFEEGGEGGW